MLKIDSHTHILPKELPNWAEKFGYGDFIRLEHHRPGYANMIKGKKFFREIKDNCWDPQVRITEYRLSNTSVQVVSTIPVMFSYWARPADCVELSQFLNDHIAALVQQYPRQYIGLGTIPMQSQDHAIRELERCKKIGLRGVQIGSNILDENLNEAKFFPIFETCAKLGMAMLIHPWNMMGEKNMSKYWLPWLVGMPAETSRAICSLIFGGIFERLPSLRVNFAHAGGSFLPTFGRIQHGFAARPDLVAIDNAVEPKKYLGKFWVDSITHDPSMLEYVVGMVGSNRVTLGSDYPFPLGDLEVGKFIEDANLPQKTMEDIFSNAAIEWLNLRKKDFE